MSVVSMDSWRLPGCGSDCAPRRHDPHAHEAYGRVLERERAAPRIVATGPLVVDLGARRVMLGGEDIHLSPTEWRFMRVLAVNVGHVVEYDDIIARVWGDDYLWMPEASRCHLRLTTLHRIRTRMRAAPGLITTIPKYGLRLELAGRDAAPMTPLALPTVRWARDWDACQFCKSTERPHAGRGLCRRCHWRQRRIGKLL